MIERPAPEVFDFVADDRNRYDPRIRRAEKLTHGPVGDGTRFRAMSVIMRRSVEMIVAITSTTDHI